MGSFAALQQALVNFLSHERESDLRDVEAIIASDISSLGELEIFEMMIDVQVEVGYCDDEPAQRLKRVVNLAKTQF